MTLPLLSLIITTRNRQTLLQRALQSVYAQDYENLEILVLDDASEDGTSDYVRSQHPDIRLFRFDVNRGLIAARNLLMREAKGDYIVSLDDDAFFVDPGTISEVVKRMEAEPKLAVASFRVVERCEDAERAPAQERYTHSFQGGAHWLNWPDHFRSWEEFTDLVPVTTRSAVQQNTEEMTSRERAPHFFRVTGGSTAEPVQTPGWRSEDDLIHHNWWLARNWYGVSPSSPLFMLWGHSHLFGTGVSGWFKARKRELYDKILRYKRFSAYDLRPAALRRAADELIAFRPEYMLGYSMALDLFARVNQDRREELRSLGLKVVIGAAEAFPAPESVDLLQDLFGCPVAMEYGCVEAGLIAHWHPEGRYRVLWKTYYLEGGKDECAPGGLCLRLTSLYPRCFPLVRYDLGDKIPNEDPAVERLLGIAAFDTVIGRCNDFVVLQDGTVVHSEMFTHAVKDCPGIRAYQVIQDGSRIRLHYVSEETVSPEWSSRIHSRLVMIHPGLAGIEIGRVEQLEQTVAGKIPMLIRRNDSSPKRPQSIPVQLINSGL